MQTNHILENTQNFHILIRGAPSKITIVFIRVTGGGGAPALELPGGFTAMEVIAKKSMQFLRARRAKSRLVNSRELLHRYIGKQNNVFDIMT